jgi:hypothetical protein
MASDLCNPKDRTIHTGQSVRSGLVFALLSLSFALLSAAAAHGESNTIQIPAATPLSVQLIVHAPMTAGETLHGRLLYPVYVDNQIAIPAGTILRGKVIRLDPDRSRRIRARLRGDFTPFHVPVVRFDQLTAPDGSIHNISGDDASNGVPLLRLSRPPSKNNRSFLASQLAEQKQRLLTDAAVITAPGKGDRLVQFFYKQLPYHPERIETDTAWIVELAAPLELRLEHPTESKPPTPVGEREQSDGAKASPPAANGPQEWQLRAYLQQSISSSSQKPGDRFEAVVAEPVFNADHSLAVPEGSILIGDITQAKPARTFNRSGRLRFHFSELKLPTGFSEPVEGTLSGIDSSKITDLRVDPEGGIQPQTQNRVIAPLVLGLLASRAFDDNGNKTFDNAIASNGFGLAGRIVGIAANSRNVAAGIGFYAAALSIYDLWLAHGHDVTFVKNTRVEVTTTPGRKALAGTMPEAKPVGSP